MVEKIRNRVCVSLRDVDIRVELSEVLGVLYASGDSRSRTIATNCRIKVIEPKLVDAYDTESNYCHHTSIDWVMARLNKGV